MFGKKEAVLILVVLLSVVVLNINKESITGYPVAEEISPESACNLAPSPARLWTIYSQLYEGESNEFIIDAVLFGLNAWMDRYPEKESLVNLAQFEIDLRRIASGEPIINDEITCKYEFFEGLAEELEFEPVFFELGANIEITSSPVKVILHGAEGIQRKTGEFFEDLYTSQGFIVHRKQVLTRDQGIAFLTHLYNNGITHVEEVLNIGHGWYDYSTPTTTFIYSYDHIKKVERPPSEKMQGSLDDAHALEYKQLLGAAASMGEGADWNFIGCHTAWEGHGHPNIANNPEASVAASYNRVFHGNGFGYSASGQDIRFEEPGKTFSEYGGMLIPWTVPVNNWVIREGDYQGATTVTDSYGTYTYDDGIWVIPSEKSEDLWNYAQGRGVRRFDYT